MIDMEIANKIFIDIDKLDIEEYQQYAYCKNPDFYRIKGVALRGRNANRENTDNKY